MRTPTLATVLLVISLPVFAQDVSHCTTIDDNATRLRCYDASSGRTEQRTQAPETPSRPISLWEQRIIDDAHSEPFTLTTYRPNYLLYTHLSSFNHEPYRFADPRDRLRDDEIKFQLSMQFKILDDLVLRNGDLWFSYTQTAYWQLFGQELSSPFREVSHEPEAYLSFLTDYSLLGFKGRGVNLGVVHQSNGRGRPLSRSWNRAFAEFQFVRGNLGVSVKPWVRLSEDADEDDNPDIEDYMGNYEVRASYEKSDHLFSLMVRNAFDSDHRYGAELSWSFPISGRLRGLLQWYNGYGENLIDYNHKNNRIGIGVLISDWL